MSLSRLKAIFVHELFITRGAIEIVIDSLVYPLMSIIVFGFLSLYLVGSTSSDIGKNVLLGMVFWQVISTVQYAVAVQSLWSIWARNLSNLFITPLSIVEYITALTISGIAKGLFIFILSALICYYVFDYNILQLGLLNLVLYILNLYLFAFSVGLVILGAIFRFGTRIQALAWGLLPIFQPLTAAFYPVSILPYPLQVAAYFFPPTFIFEANRASMGTTAVHWQFISFATVENIMYIVIAIWFFNMMFQKSKETGQFARNEG